MLLRFAVTAALCCVSCAAPPSGAPSTPKFADAPCAFRVPAGRSVRCGWLRVPENRDRPRTRTIRLHVAIYSAAKPNPAPDPILWLVGGPGGRAHALSSALFDRVVKPYADRRDFIVVDIRGTGYSEPSLSCGVDGSMAVEDCRLRLARIADLSCYNSSAVAADLADLRAALGIKEWNVFGESYGTRLALIALRDHPEGIRSVILDSVVPPEADQYADGPAKFENALNALFRACAADLRCNSAFPDLRSKLLHTADLLDRSPRRVTGQWRGVEYDARFDGRALMRALHAALYDSDLIPRLPKAIYELTRNGDNPVWGQAIGTASIIATKLIDQGAHWSFHCWEEFPFTDTRKMREEAAQRPWMRDALAVGIEQQCRVWLPRGADIKESRAVESAVPTLLLAGEMDPTTPPSYAQSAASHLTNGHLFVFPGMGHWLSANTVTDCPQKLILEFLDHPSVRPRDQCANDVHITFDLN